LACKIAPILGGEEALAIGAHSYDLDSKTILTRSILGRTLITSGSVSFEIQAEVMANTVKAVRGLQRSDSAWIHAAYRNAFLD
jgi:hypothetical protein